MKETKIYADEFCTTFASTTEMLEFLAERAKQSKWIRKPTRMLKLVPLEKEAETIEEACEKELEGIVEDTEKNTQLVLKVNKDFYPVRDCAIHTILKRAGINGTGLKKLEKATYDFMIKKVRIAVDHGNRNMKTCSRVFTTGLTIQDKKPARGEKFLFYEGKYYVLSENRIPYQRDKTHDDRFFVLTLFAIVKELEENPQIQPEDVIQVDLPIGLPPKHYAELCERYEAFHLYEWIYHDRKYHKICEVLDNRLLRYIDTISEGEQNIEDFNTGIFSGEGSILYTLGILYEIYDDIKYKEYFDKWLNCMETLILEDRLFDMISGNSGIVLVLINMYRKTKKPIYLQKAIQIAEQLIENMITENGKVGWKSEVVPEVLAGFAHGNSGFIELFSRLYEVYPQTKYLDILSSLVEYENSLYSEKDNNWIDLRKFSEVDQHKSQPIAWCHGAAGILLSRLTLYNAIKNLGETALLQQAIKDISLAKNKLIEDGLHAGFCLCHGNMGNLLILKRYAEIFDDKQVRSICDSRFEQILEFLNEENILPTELYNPGFMTGLSGIAYALLKYKMPKLPLLIGVEGIYDRNEV